MSYIYKKRIANRKNYGSQRSTSQIKYIILHYTANDGDTDENNGIYFKRNIVEASAHYFVDSDSVTQSVPDDYVAWSVGGAKYASCEQTGGGSFYGLACNTNSISIELCDDVRNGVIYPSEKTIENALELTKSLMKKYNVPASRVIRHFDVNGKICPAYWCGTDAKNKKWAEIKARLGDTSTTTAKPAGKKLAVDGDWGKATTTKLQKVLGTTQDGIVSKQSYSCKKYLQNCHTSSWKYSLRPTGSQMVKALQKKLGVKTDGLAGKNTIKALQKFLGVKVDGYCGKITVKALQTWLNKQ